MKKNFFLIIISLIVCITISLIIEIFAFNHLSINLSEKDHSISEVSFTTKKKDGKEIIEINLDNTLIRKLIINYTATKNTEYKVSYNYLGLYNNETKDTLTDIFDKSFSATITNYDKNISHISISFDPSNVTIHNISIDNDFHFNISRFFFIFIAILIIGLIIYFFRKGFATEKIHIYFAILASLLGMLVIIAQPAANFYSWDDQTHFDRILSWFKGNIKYNHGEYNESEADINNSAGRDSISSIEEQVNQKEYLDTDINHDYSKTVGLYTPYGKTPYLPMVIGYHGAKLLGFSFTACFQIGKIFNLLFYVFLMTYAIKTLVTGKRLLAFIALLPTNLFLATQYSYDPSVFAGITIFVIHLINLLINKDSKFDYKTAFIMLLAITYACLAKAVYAPLLLLILLIPNTKFNISNNKKILLIKLCFAIISLLLMCTLALPAIGGSTSSDPRGGSTSVVDQAKLVISHPQDYATILKTTAGDNFINELIGPGTISNFAYIGINGFTSNLYFILIIMLIFFFLTDNHKNTLSIKNRTFLIITNLIIILLIWSALYFSFTPVGLDTINGVQGRYFLPLLFPILFSLQSSHIRNNISPQIYNTIALAVPSILMIIITYSLILVPYSF